MVGERHVKTLGTIRKVLRSRDIPSSWQVDLPDDPEAPVEVMITPLARHTTDRSPKRFLGAGKGLFSSAAEIDAYLQRNRDTWEE